MHFIDPENEGGNSGEDTPPFPDEEEIEFDFPEEHPSDNELILKNEVDAIYWKKLREIEESEKPQKRDEHCEKLPFADAHHRYMQLSDIKAPGGVRECYEDSMIPDQAIVALKEKTTVQAEELLRKGRGGMLHHFNVRPKRYGLLHQQRTESVEEQMVRLLREGKKIRQSRRAQGKKSPSLYEGAVLVPESEKEQTILAWATWTRSLVRDTLQRTPQNDESVADITRLIDKKIMLDQGLKIAPPYADILLFDTLNGRYPGAASVLFQRLLPTWKRLGYNRVLLYRHKILQCVEPGGERATGKPVGNNDASERFFRKRGMREIGTRLSDVYAIREIEGKTYRVAPTEGWMLGDIDLMKQRCKEVAQGERDFE